MVSLLRSEGHPEAHHYPVCRVWTETKIVNVRKNKHYKMMAMVILNATAAGVGGGQKNMDLFNAFLEKFGDGKDH